MKKDLKSFERDDKTFTIVASRSHMSPVKTKDFVQQMKDKHGAAKSYIKGSSLKLCMVAEGQANCYRTLHPLWNGIRLQDGPYVYMPVFKSLIGKLKRICYITEKNC